MRHISLAYVISYLSWDNFTEFHLQGKTERFPSN